MAGPALSGLSTKKSAETEVMMPQVAQTFAAGQRDIVLGYLAIARRVLPELASVFGTTIAVEKPHPNIIALEMPPIGKALIRRRAMFFMRKFYFGSDSREHDFAARMSAGIARGGWDCVSLDPTFIGREWVSRTGGHLFELVQDGDIDVVIIDFCGLVLAPSALIDFINLCRRFRPQMRIVLIHFDPWQKQTWTTTAMLGAQADLVWSHFPSQDIWQAPGLSGQVSFAPFPVGIGLEEFPSIPRRPINVFQGAVETYNASRAFWLASLEKSGSPIQVRLTGHGDDGKPPLDSYRDYLRGFLDCQCLVNFSMRQDGSRIITGRTFEAIHAGTCLIQEQADDVEYYFRPGEHFLSFSTLTELQDLLVYVAENPGYAAQIARQGQSYFRDRYDDSLLVAHLEQRLFGAPLSATGAS